MSKKLGLVVALVGVCALSLFLLSCGSSSSRPSGLLYVLTQGSSGIGNNVSSFAIDLNSGNLSLINSNASTCTTSGVSCGLPLDIILDPTGATAFVLNQGVPSAGVAPTIYAYTVNSDGSLGAPPTTATATLTVGDTAVAMTRDAAGKFLFVIDQGSVPSAANCQFLPPNFPNVACASISVFTMQPGSTTLSAVAGSPFPVGRIPSALSAIALTPPTGAVLPCATTTEFLYVTFNSDPALHNDNTLSAYCLDSSGTPKDLTPNSPYATQPNPLSVLAVNTNPAGQNSGGVFVYVGNQGSATGAVSGFQVCTVVGQDPVGMVVDPTNKFLYVVNEGSSQVFGFRIGTTEGTLTALTPANLSTGSQPVALAMHSSGKFLYTSNNNASSISAFAVSTTSGSMSSLNTVSSPSGPRGMAAR